MSLLFDKVESLLDKAINRTGKSKSKLLGLIGITSSQYDRCIRENRPFSDPMLKSMGDSEYIDATYQQLIGWKLADEYGVEDLGPAFYSAFSELPQRDRLKILAVLISELPESALTELHNLINGREGIKSKKFKAGL